MTPEEITKLAEVLAKDWIDTTNLPNCLGNEVLSGMTKEMERVVHFILRTHCIVEKSKVQGLYRHYKSHCDKDTDFEFGNGAVYVLDDLFDSQLGKEAAL